MRTGTIGLGNVAAAILSYTTHHSIGWMIVHALFSWLYVIYWALGGGQ